MEIPIAGGGGALMAICWRGELVCFAVNEFEKQEKQYMQMMSV